MVCFHIISPCDAQWTWLVLEGQDVIDTRGYLANMPTSVHSTLNNVQDVSFLIRKLCFLDRINHEIGVCDGVIGALSAD